MHLVALGVGEYRSNGYTYGYTAESRGEGYVFDGVALFCVNRFAAPPGATLVPPPLAAGQGMSCKASAVARLVLNLWKGGFKFQVQRVNDGAVAHRLPGAWGIRVLIGGRVSQESTVHKHEIFACLKFVIGSYSYALITPWEACGENLRSR